MKKKKIIAVVLVALAIGGLCGGVAFAAGNAEELLLKDDQRYVYAYVTSIQGNEITYMEVEESVVETLLGESEETDDADDKDSSKDAENEDVKNEAGENQSTEGGDSDATNPGFPSGGEMPDMSSMPSGGEMPDMSSMPEMGEMPDMSSMPEMGEMPDMSNMPSGGGFPGGDSTESASSGEESGRGNGRGGAGKQESSGTDKMQMGSFGGTTTVTTYIPVGVTVHTAADVSTTFSRLASGDLVKILVETNDAEEDVILEIWMLQ